jgi:hypothetical protein
LRDAGGDEARTGECEEASNVGGEAWAPACRSRASNRSLERAGLWPPAQKAGADHQQLREPGEHDGLCEQGGDRRRRRDTDSRDPCQDKKQHGVEGHSAERHRDDAPLRIERRGKHGDNAGKCDVGRRDAKAGGRQRMSLSVKSRREQGDNRAGEHDSDDRQCDDSQQHDAEHLLEEPIGASLALRPLDPQPGGNEGGIDRAFGQQPAEKVGDLKDGKKGIGEDSGAQDRCDAGVAGKSQQPRRQCCAAHGRDVACKRHAGGLHRYRIGERPAGRHHSCGMSFRIIRHGPLETPLPDRDSA